MTAEAFMRTIHPGSDEGCPTCDLLNIIDREREATAAAEQRLAEAMDEIGRLRLLLDALAVERGTDFGRGYAEGVSASPRQGEPVEGLGELAAKAEEYIEAVVTYLDPVNQFTYSRRHHVDRTGEELAELVAAALLEPTEAET